MKKDEIKERIEQQTSAIRRMLGTPDGEVFKQLLMEIVTTHRNPTDPIAAGRMIGEHNLALRILEMENV